MSDIEKKNNGIEAISDDELDAVAGGEMYDTDPNSPQMQQLRAQNNARADGRREKIGDSTGLCKCPLAYVFARSVEKTLGGKTYHDIKCYSCGKTWKKYKDFFA